jgi:hypothetical protein
MTCETCRSLLQNAMDHQGHRAPGLASHLQGCAACKAYAEWLEAAISELHALPTVRPRRRIGRALRQQLMREGLLVRVWSPARGAGVAALGWAAVAVGLVLALRPGFATDFLKIIPQRAWGLIRPLWVTAGGIGERAVPVARHLVRGVDPALSWAAELPWLEASAISLAAAAAVGASVLWLGALERRRFGHAMVL